MKYVQIHSDYSIIEAESDTIRNISIRKYGDSTITEILLSDRPLVISGGFSFNIKKKLHSISLVGVSKFTYSNEPLKK